MMGKVIGNETGWDGTVGSGAASAFDGDPATFFDPLGVADGYCGMEYDEPYILEKVVILSRYVDANWNERFEGAMIEGSNDGEEWETLWTSEEQGTAPDYYVVTEFENNYGYKMFRYFNDYKHGDVAEVEFYGTPGTAERPAEEPKAEEPVAEEPKTEEPVAEEPKTEEPTAEEPKTEEPAAETPTTDNKPAETAKSGCGSMIGGGFIVLVTILGSAWIAKRK
jgi:Periplasmic protein TonB, links inner and outer membranes